MSFPVNYFQNTIMYVIFGIPPTPDRGPNPHFLEKRVLGSKNPISPRSGKGSFLPKNPLFFFYKGTHRKWGFSDRKLPFPAFVIARGNGGFWTPKKPSFPRNGDSGPCLGSGESQCNLFWVECYSKMPTVRARCSGPF